MRYSRRLLLPVVLAAALVSFGAHAERKTVCTITVNSADEREAFRRYLPAGDYDFVELVERGRADWLASACRRNVHCDVLIVSGHFDGGDVFYTDRFDRSESLPTEELDRVSCSDSCPGLFSQLKEVYLFGCNTLDAQPSYTATPEIARSLVRAGYTAADADGIARSLAERHGESNRDRMRAIFHDVPAIYGFSSKAPLGRSAGPLLDKFFQAGGGADVASGRASGKLLALFAPSSMTFATGMSATESLAAVRRDVCMFYDDRVALAGRIDFVHALLARPMAEVRMLLDPIEKALASLDDRARASPAVARALASIASDDAARARFLDFARDADAAATRVRMIDVAAALGWLTPAQQRAEVVRMFAEMLARGAIGAGDVDLACTRNRDGALAHDVQALPATLAKGRDAALLACLGRSDAHAGALDALTSADERDVEAAQVYLRHHAIADAGEVRALTADIARMGRSAGQVRALDALAQQRVSDRDSLRTLAELFPIAKSLDVQRAIAGILIHGDYPSIASADLVRSLRQSRVRSPDGEDVIDVLIRRVQAAL